MIEQKDTHTTKERERNEGAMTYKEAISAIKHGHQVEIFSGTGKGFIGTATEIGVMFDLDYMAITGKNKTTWKAPIKEVRRVA